MIDRLSKQYLALIEIINFENKENGRDLQRSTGCWIEMNSGSIVHPFADRLMSPVRVFVEMALFLKSNLA